MPDFPQNVEEMPLPAVQPLTAPASLPIAPMTAALVVGAVVAVAGVAWPHRPRRPRPERPWDSWDGRLDRPRGITRALAVAALVLAVVIGRAGPQAQLANPAPALVVGLAWPLLLAASLALGPVWRWLDPWDAVGRTFDPEPGTASGDVRWAVLPAGAWVWYLTAYPDALQPSSVAGALFLYSVLTVGGMLAFGRVAWLARAEVFGLILSWAGRMRSGGLSGWQPARGAEVVLGVLGGGLVFGLVRSSGLPTSGMRIALGLGVAVLAGGLLAWALARWERALGSAGSVAAALVPVIGGVALALSMARGRLVVSALLLPRLVSDPLGRGWDPFGLSVAPVPVDPLTAAGRGWVQLGILAAAAVAAGAVAARRGPREGRSPALVAGTAFLSAAAIGVGAA